MMWLKSLKPQVPVLRRWVSPISFCVFKVQHILSELVMGGMVLETNMTEIITRIEEQNKLEKSEVIIIKDDIIFEPCSEKTGFFNMRKQRRRSASR